MRWLKANDSFERWKKRGRPQRSQSRGADGRRDAAGRHLLAVALFAAYMIGVGGSSAGADAAESRASDPEKVPNDRCVVEILAPPGGRLNVDGRDYGSKRQLTYGNQSPNRIVTTRLRYAFAGGSARDRTVHLNGGRRLRVVFRDPAAVLPELQLQTGHSSAPNEVAMSGDGRYVATASSNVAILWDADTGRALRTYSARGAICGLAITSDGRKIITASRPEVVAWDHDSGEQILRIPGHFFINFAATPDGNTIVTYGANSVNAEWRVTVWDGVNGSQRSQFAVRSEITHDLAISADGRRLAGAGGGGIVLCDATTGREITFRGRKTAQEGSFLSCGFSPDSAMLLVTFRHTPVYIVDCGGYKCATDFMTFDAGSGKPLQKTTLPDDLDGKPIFISEGREICCSLGGHWHLFDKDVLGDQRRSARSTSAWRTASNGNGTRICDGRETLDTTTWKAVSRFVHSQRPARRASYTSRGNVLVEDSKSISGLSPTNGQIEFTIPKELRTDDATLHIKENSAICDRYLMTLCESATAAGRSTEVARFSLNDGRLVDRMPVSAQVAAYHDRLSPSRDGMKVLLAGWRSGQPPAALWDLASQRLVRALEFKKVDYYSSDNAVLDPNGRLVAIGYHELDFTSDHRNRYAHAKIFDATSGSEIRTLRLIGDYGSVVGSNVIFDASGARLATLGTPLGQLWPSFVIIWDIRTGNPLRVLSAPSEKVKAFMFCANNPELGISYHLDRDDAPSSAKVWELTSGRPLRSFKLVGIESAFVGGSTSAPSLSPDGEMVLVSSPGGMLLFYDVATGDERVRLLPLNDGANWLAVTPEGLFDGTELGRKKVAFRIGKGLNVVPVERFFKDFYHPGLLAELARGERPLPSGQLAAAVAPTVRIVAPQNVCVVEKPSVTIDVQVTDRGGGISGPWLMQNGSRVLADGEKRQDKGKVLRTFNLPLVEGENRIEVRAASADESWESEPAVLVVRYEKPLAKPTVHVVAVGINRYATEAMNLRFAVADAEAIAKLFENRGPALYGQGHVHTNTVFDDKATQAGIREALADAARTTNPQDTIVLFLAGHGMTLGQRYYFITHEFKQRAEHVAEDVRDQAVPADVLCDLLAKASALKRVLILDTCQSGGAVSLAPMSRDPFAFRGALERLSHATGTFTIAAAAANSQAQEVPQLRHGILTYALLAGLRAVDEGPLTGQAVATAAKTEVADVREWFSFAQDKVPLLTKLYTGEEQFVGFSGQGSSFPILPLGDEQ